MRRAIYDYFTTQTDSNGDTFNLGTFEEFEKDMNDPKIRKSFYDYMSSQIDDNGDYYNLGTFEEFEKDVAPKKTISAEQQAPQQVAPQSQYIVVSLPKTQPVQGGIPKQEATTTPIIAVDNKTEGMVAENETPTAPQAGTPINPSEGVMETPKEEQLNIAPTPQGVTPVAEETTQESLSEQKEIEAQGNQGSIAEVQEAEETKPTPEGEAKEVTLEDVISSHKTALGEGEAVYNDYVVDNIPEWIDQGMLGNPYIYDYNVQTSNIIFNAVRNNMISEGKTPSQDEVVAKIKGMSSEDIDKALTEKDKSKIVAEKNRYESAFINKGEATSILGKAMENEQLRKYLAMAIGKDENASAEDVAIALSATVRGLDGDLRKALDSKNKEYDVVRKALADYYNVKGIFGNDAYDEFMSSEIGKDTDVMNMGQLWRKMFGYANSPLYPRKYKELVTDAMRQVHATHTSDTKEGKEYLNNAIGRIDSYLDVKNQVSPDKMNELLQTINSRLPGTQRLNSWEDVFFYQHPTTYPIPMELTPQGIALDALNSYLNNTLLKDANEGEIKALEARVNERATENMAKTQLKLDSNPLLLLDENKALQTNRASNWGMDQEYLLLKDALDIRKDAYEYGENAGKDESFVSNLWRGFADKAFDIKNWDLGLSKFGEAANLMLIIDKSEKGEELTYAENAFIDAIATDFAVKSITKASRGYKAGMVTAEALPFMAEMLFSPLKGGGAMANKFARLMLKKYGKDTIKKNAGKYLMGKVGSRLLGDLGKAYGMALTTGAMNVGADAINRNVGKVKYNIAEGGKIVALKDEEGKIVTEDAVGGAEAIFDAINSRAIENFSEFTGGYLPGGVWLKSLANKVGLSKAVKYYDKISSTAWAKNADRFFERTQWHGPIEEFNEEMIGGVLNAIVVGDQTLDTAENTGVFNNDNLIDTALGVGVMSVLMSSVKTMGYRTASQQLEAQKKNTIKLGEDVLGDDWADIQSTIDNATAYNLAKDLKALLSNNKYSAEGKRIIMRYGMEVAEGDALISAEERQQMAYESETKVDNASRLEGSARLGWNTTDANEQYVANKQYEERGNAVVDMLQFDGKSADDALLSRYGVSDSYDIADMVSADADLNTKQKQTILGYLDSREQVVAMGQRALHDTQISAVNAVRNDKSNIQSGKTIVATHKVDGREMYVIDGNVALNEDGTISVGNSDDSIIVENKETGEREFISPSMFSAVTEQESANVMSDAVSAKSQSYTNAMTYGHTLEQGEDIVIDGVTHKVASVDYDKGVVLFADGETVDLETLAQDADRRNAERTKAEVVEKVAPKEAEKPQATPTEVNQEVERTAPQQEYTQGKAIVYKDASGNYRMAEVMREADPDGNIIIIDTFTGDTHQVPSSQLDQWQAEVNAPQVEEITEETPQEDTTSIQGILDNSIPVAENAPIAVDVTEEVEAENPTATTETQVEVTPQVAEQPQTPTTQVAIPTDEKGNPLYEQMSVEDTISNLYNDPDLEDDEADAFVTNKIAKAQQGVDELAKNKPQMGDNILQFKAEKKQWESQIAEAQRVLDYWNGVKAQRASMKEESTEVAQPQTTPMVEAEEKIEGTPQAEQKQSIKSETTPGIVRNAYSAYVPKGQVEQLDKVAQALGVQIELVPTMRGANAKIVGNKVTVALDAEQIQQEGANGVIMVIGHELTHRIKSLSNEAFEDFASVIESILPEEFKQRMIATRLAYSRQGLKISNEALREEVVADLAGIVMANKGTMEKFLKALEPKSTKQQILDVLKQMFEAIKGVFQGEFAREIAKAEKVLLESMKKASAVVNEGNTIEADNTGSVTTEHKGNTESFTNFYTNRKPTARIGSNTDNQHPSSSQSVSTDKVSDKVGDVQEDSSIVDINEKEGQALFSLRTYNEGGRESLQNFVASQVDKGALTQEQAQEIVEEMETIYDICEQYTGEYAPFGNWSEAEVVRDERGIPVLSVIKANGDYKMNLDFSLVCKKRRTLDAVFQEMINRGVISNYELGQVDIARVNDIIREHGFETACRLCFVDSKRFRTPKVADDFATLYNELVDMSDTQLKKVIKGEAKNTVRKKASKHLLEHPEDRIKVGRDNFITAQGFEQMKKDRPYILSLYNMAKGSGGPKASFGDVQYMNDVQNTNWTPEEAYAVGGVRLQSFSDYVPRMVFDYVQLLADLSAKQLPVHAYTKEPIFAKQFGLSGIKINLSLVPRVDIDGVAPGLDKDGNYAWQEGETFPYDVAVELQNAEGYKENVGTIAVGVSDEHIAKLLDDPNIRMVIPYHKSGLNKQVAIKNNIDAFVDYTNSQNTRKADGTKVAKAGLNGMPDFNQDIHSGMHPREAAQRYLDWCEKKGYLPKFDQFKDHPNYYKMLEDFTTIIEANGEERVVPQGAVSMTFPTENDAFGSMESLIKEGLEEDAILEGNRQAKVGEIVDEIEEVLAKGEQAKYSLRSNSQEVADIIAKAKADGTYMKAPNGEATNLTEEQWANVRTKAFKDWFGDWEKDPKNASKIVDENGEPMVVYHGTEGKFNVFDRTKGRASMDIQGMFFSPWELDAQGYGRNVRAFYLNIRKPSSGGQSYKALNRYQGQMYAGVKARDYLIGLGYDGVNNYGEEFIAFNPNQIKSATENVGTYSSESDDVRYSLRDTIPFYSNAERAVENIKQGKATPEQWLAMIQKNGGLKAGEDKWLGLSDWLKSSDAKTLTKEEVLEFIKANQIVVEEVNYGGASIVSVQSEFDKLTEEHGNYEGAFEEMVNRYGDDFSMAVWYDEYGQLHLEEGYEDYGEILGMERGINPTRLEYTTQGLENNKEIALVVPSIEPYNQYDEIHFGDAGDGRAVAWVRFGETRAPRQVEVVRRAEGFDSPYKNANGGDVFKVKWRKNDTIVYTPLRDGRKKYIPYVNGKFIGTTEETAFFDTFEEAQEAMNRYYVEHPVYKTVYDNVLVIDEIQSKRHQDGREKGYKGKDIAQRKARIDEIRERLRVISERRSEISDLIPTDIRGILNRANYRKTMPENEEFERLRDEDIALRRELDEITLSISERNAVPDAPFDKNWHELAMKRMLRYAAENGFDKVAWTTGEQQAERYNMGRAIDNIWHMQGKGEFNFNKDGFSIGRIKVNDEGIVEEAYGFFDTMEYQPLSNIVGKELAEKMMNSNPNDEIEVNSLIGGEGMKGFYDKMLPSFMNKYGKKWGVKVGETTMPNIGDNGLTMHSIDVTDEMKKSVMEGQPLFSLRGTTDVQLKEDVMGEMMERNPKGWESIKDKLRGTPIWNEVVNNEEFADVRDDEDVITGEVLSRLKVNIDDLTEQMVNNAKGIFEKADAVAMADRMRRALKEFNSWVEKEGLKVEDVSAQPIEGEDVRYSLRTKADPQNTIEVYKLFNVDENGMPQALFIDADNKLELGVWYDADSPKVKDLENLEPGKAYLINEDGDVVEEKEFKINVAKGGKKSISSLPSKEQVVQATKDGYRWMTVRLGADGERQYHTLGINGAGGVTDYALRPGWHATDSPSARHIGEGKSGANAIYRKPNQRWFKVEISADHDYNEEAREGYLKAHPKAQRNEVYDNLKGDITDKIPEDGFYNFKTNSNANPNQSWFIAGAMKIVEPLTEEEAHEISRANGVEIDLPYKDGVKTFEDVKYSLRGDVDAINNKFNEELQQQIDGTLPEGHIYQLGLPSEILLDSGFPNMPIEMSSSNLYKHSTKNHHSFELKDIYDLVNSIQKPIAIFAYGDKEKSQNLIVELQKDGRNFLVGVHFNQARNGLEVSSIRGLFPKDSAEWLNWISQGKALYLDKKRIQDLTNQQRKTLADVEYLDLNSITKLVNDFDETNISVENNQQTLKYSLRGVLHPKGDGDYDGTRAEYNRRVGVQKGMRKLGYKFREGHQDSMLSLKILQEIVAKANGKDPKNLPSWQDAYVEENLMSSRNKAEKDIYMRDFFKPLMEEVEKLLKKGMGYEEITQYMIAKHGLERNALMAERVAKEEADKVLTERDNLAKRVARVKANKAVEGVAFADWTAKKEAWKQEYDNAYNAEKLAEDEAQDLWMKEYKKAIKEAKGRDFSGLTALFDVEGVKEAEIKAQALIDEVERDYNMDSLWNKVRKATQESLATQYKAGLISRQTYDKVRDMYQYYIPLKGFKEMTTDEEYEYLATNTPLLPSLDKKAMGRSSVADDPLATIAMDADAAIIKANRNKMKQAFYHFVKNNPSSLVSINEQWYIKDPVSGRWVVSMPIINADATGEEIQQAIEEHEERMKELAETGDATTKTKDLELDYIALPQHQIEHAVRVKINGKEYVMYINGNPRAAQALNGLTNPEAFNDVVTKFGKKVNNFMAQMFTSGNPAFIFTNGMRDIQWATNAVMIKEGMAYQMEYAKCLAKAMQIPRLIIKEGSGSLNMDKETQKYFDEFIRYGGETGYTAIHQIDDYKKKVDQLVNGVKWYDTPLESAKKVIEGVEYLNRSVEDVTRFAVYMASRKMGRTPQRSAYDAKEITVNFNKKGSGIMGARYMSAFYLFYNASIQSLNGLAKLYKQNPIKASARTAMWAGVNAMLPILNELLIEAWGDDDDKEAYENLPEWVRKNNLVFYIPGTDAKFFTISLPHEMRPWTTIGYVANEVFSGKMEAEESFKHIALGFADMLPMDFAGNGGNIVVNLTPTWAQPMTQILFNVDYFGKPVYKNSDYNENKPEFTTAFKGTSPILVDLSRAVNAIGGGDESKKGSVDVINPDVVQHLVESYFGGVGKTINKSLNTIAMLGDEDMREVKNIPIVSSFMIGNEERTSTGYKANQRYYEIKDEVSKYDDALSIRKDIIMQGVRANATQEEKDKANEYFEKLVEDADSKNTKQYLFAKGYIDYIDKLRRGLDDIDQSRREEVEKNISDAMIELNKGYNKADEKSIEELKKQKEDLSQKARDLIEGWNGKNFIDDTYQNNKWAKKDLNEAVREFNPNALREWKNKHNIVKDK